WWLCRLEELYIARRPAHRVCAALNVGALDAFQLPISDLSRDRELSSWKSTKAGSRLSGSKEFDCDTCNSPELNAGIYGLRCYRQHPSDLDEELMADGFEPVSAALFSKFRFRRANVSQLHNRIVACATALAAVTRSLRRTRSSGVGHSL